MPISVVVFFFCVLMVTRPQHLLYTLPLFPPYALYVCPNTQYLVVFVPQPSSYVTWKFCTHYCLINPLLRAATGTVHSTGGCVHNGLINCPTPWMSSPLCLGVIAESIGSYFCTVLLQVHVHPYPSHYWSYPLPTYPGYSQHCNFYFVTA